MTPFAVALGALRASAGKLSTQEMIESSAKSRKKTPHHKTHAKPGALPGHFCRPKYGLWPRVKCRSLMMGYDCDVSLYHIVPHTAFIFFSLSLSLYGLETPT